jgi:hypothetical protein
MALAGVCGTILGGLVTWRYGRRFRIAVVGLGLAALDDAVSHAFGVWTPLDHLWGVWWAVYHGNRVPVLAAFARDPATTLCDLRSAVGPALADLPAVLLLWIVRGLARLPGLAPHSVPVPI